MRIKIVIDTNLLVAAFRKKGGTSEWILDLWRSGGVSLLVSEGIMDEYRRVLTPPLVKKSFGESLVNDMRERAEIIVVKTRDETVVKADPSDDKLLFCASEGSADYLVTSDQHLLMIGEFGGVRIVNPKVFKEEVEGLRLKDHG